MYVCVCVCVCVSERERERWGVVSAQLYNRVHMCVGTCMNHHVPGCSEADSDPAKSFSLHVDIEVVIIASVNVDPNVSGAVCQVAVRWGAEDELILLWIPLLLTIDCYYRYRIETTYHIPGWKHPQDLHTLCKVFYV